MKEFLPASAVLDLILTQSKICQVQLAEALNVQRRFQDMNPLGDDGREAQYSAVAYAAKKADRAQEKLEMLRALYKKIKQLGTEGAK
jgi:hypothetical protein